MTPRDGLDSARFIANTRSAQEHSSRASQSGRIRYDLVCFVFARPSYDLSLTPRPLLCRPASPNLHMFLSSTQTLTQASHLISIGPDQACLEVSELPAKLHAYLPHLGDNLKGASTILDRPADAWPAMDRI